MENIQKKIDKKAEKIQIKVFSNDKEEILNKELVTFDFNNSDDFSTDANS